MRALALCLLLLAGCREAKFAQADDKLVCDQQGQAFVVQPHIGDTSFVRRLPSGDAVCARMKP